MDGSGCPMGTPDGPATLLAPSAGHCRASHKLHSHRWGAPAPSLKATKHRAEYQLLRSAQQETRVPWATQCCGQSDTAVWTWPADGWLQALRCEVPHVCMSSSLRGEYCSSQDHLSVGFSFMWQNSPEKKPGKFQGLCVPFRPQTGVAALSNRNIKQTTEFFNFH